MYVSGSRVKHVRLLHSSFCYFLFDWMYLYNTFCLAYKFKRLCVRQTSLNGTIRYGRRWFQTFGSAWNIFFCVNFSISSCLFSVLSPVSLSCIVLIPGQIYSELVLRFTPVFSSIFAGLYPLLLYYITYLYNFRSSSHFSDVIVRKLCFSVCTYPAAWLLLARWYGAINMWIMDTYKFFKVSWPKRRAIVANYWKW